MSKNMISVLLEGEKTENLLFANINKLFLEATVILIRLPLGMSIYMLWNKMMRNSLRNWFGQLMHTAMRFLVLNMESGS